MKTLQPNICFIGAGGGSEGAAGGDENNSSAAAQEAANLGIGTSASIGATSMGISAAAGTAEAAGQAAGGFGTWGGNAAAVAQDIANNMTPASAIASAVVPGYGMLTAARSISNVFDTGSAPGSNSGGSNSGGNGDAPQGLAAAAAPAAIPDPVAPAKQTISSPDSPEQQAAAVQARRRKVSRPLINGGFLGTTAGGVSDTGQTQTPTGPSLGTSSTLGPGAGFVRKKNTF